MFHIFGTARMFCGRLFFQADGQSSGSGGEEEDEKQEPDDSEAEPQAVPAADDQEVDVVVQDPAPSPKEVLAKLLGEGKKEDQEPSVFLVLFKLDDSTSIGSYGYKSVICENHNKCLADLRALQTNDWILVATETFHGYRHNDFVSPADARDLTIHDYRTIYGTPLNLQVAAGPLETDTKAQEFRDKGMCVYRIVFTLSDGLNTPKEAGHDFPAEETRRIVTESIAKEDLIMLALGVQNGAVDFYRTFEELGIPRQWITVCEGDPVKVRDSLDDITRIISSASSSSESFHETRLGRVLGEE